jgi:hypothetical protein
VTLAGTLLTTEVSCFCRAGSATALDSIRFPFPHPALYSAFGRLVSRLVTWDGGESSSQLVLSFSVLQRISIRPDIWLCPQGIVRSHPDFAKI